MSQSIACIETARASTYLQQLCKHFAHKLPVSFTPEVGTIAFDAGRCRLRAGDGKLTLTIEAEDAGEHARLQEVIERHLQRFAFREPLAMAWRTVAEAAG